MPKKTDSTTTARDAAPANGLDIARVTETGQRSLAAVAHLHSRVFRDALRFNAELLDFAHRRLRKDIETSDRLSRCESVTDAMEVMTDFCQSAFRDYAEQTSAMIRNGAAITSQSTEETAAEAGRVTATPGA